VACRQGGGGCGVELVSAMLVAALAGVVTLRWGQGRWTYGRVRVVVATLSGSGCGGCRLGKLVASGGGCGKWVLHSRSWRSQRHLLTGYDYMGKR